MDMYSLYNNTKEWFDLVDILYAEEEIHSGNNLERVLKINLNYKYDGKCSINFIFVPSGMVAIRLRHFGILKKDVSIEQVLCELNRANIQVNGFKFCLEEDKLALFIDEWVCDDTKSIASFLTNVTVLLNAVNSGTLNRKFVLDDLFLKQFDDAVLEDVSRKMGRLTITLRNSLNL